MSWQWLNSFYIKDFSRCGTKSKHRCKCIGSHNICFELNFLSTLYPFPFKIRFSFSFPNYNCFNTIKYCIERFLCWSWMKNKNTNILNAFNIINMYDLNVVGLFTCIPTLFFLLTFLYWKEKPPYHRKPFKLHKVFFHFNFQGFLWLFCMSEIICLFWEGGKYVLEVISVK